MWIIRSWYEDQTFPTYLQAEKHIRTDLYRPSTDLTHSTPNTTANTYPSSQMEIGTDMADFYPSDSAARIANANTHAFNANTSTNAALRAKSFSEQQAVLNLRLLSQSGDSSTMNGTAPTGPTAAGPLSGDAVAELTNALVADAPPEVTQAIQRDERAALLHLQNLIQQRLAIVSPRDEEGERTEVTVNGNRRTSDFPTRATMEKDINNSVDLIS